MKKSVLILIGIIYISAIVIVGFFGMKVTAYDEMVYITDIVCTNENIRENSDNTKTLRVNYIEGGSVLENTVILTYDVYPKNSTLKGADAVSLVYDENTKVATVDGLKVTFLKKGVLTVQLKSKDGSNIIETVKIIAY